jgi:hypothetical protein
MNRILRKKQRENTDLKREAKELAYKLRKIEK